MPTRYVDTNVTCAISIAPVNAHQLPFHLTSATGGLQEALSQNLTSPATNTIILNNAWYQPGGRGGRQSSNHHRTVQGSANLGLMDITQVPTAWYQWNGSQYVKVSLTGSAGNLGTLQSDLVGNNQTNTAAVDLYDFVATAPTSGVATYSPRRRSTPLQPTMGRRSSSLAPGGRPSPTRALPRQDNRSDVPATARSVTEDGALCDAAVYGTLTQG